MKTIYVINGPNINMLGIREPEQYGTESYDCLKEKLRNHAREKGCEVMIYQSNHEGDLVDMIQEAYFHNADGIIINPAAYTHTSIALLDALKATRIPAVEVHLTDVSRREDFRKISYIRAAVQKTIMGHGMDGYMEAMDFLLEGLKKNESDN